MVIGGLHPCSFSDYPARTAAVVFTQGCNFCCPFCHNGHLIPAKDEGAHDVETLLDFLQRRKGLIDGVVISGGEPTVHEDLPEFMKMIKKIGFPVKLDTNGSCPAVLERIIKERLADYIAMDIKAPFCKYHLLAGKQVDTDAIEESISLIACSGTPHHFRTTYVPGLLGEDDMENIRSFVPAGSEYKIQPFVAENAWNMELAQVAC